MIIKTGKLRLVCFFLYPPFVLSVFRVPFLRLGLAGVAGVGGLLAVFEGLGGFESVWLCVFVMPGNCFGCLSVAFFAQGISFFKINTFFLPKYLVVEKKCRTFASQLRIATYWTFSSAGLEHLPYKQRVGGSNPSTSTKQ